MIKRILAVVQDYDWDTDDPALNADAAFCLSLFTRWFGEPRDAHRAMHIVLGPRWGCGRNPLMGTYEIFINRDLHPPARRFEALAHEVFHRVTWYSWISRALYVCEMMAFLASQHALLEAGHSQFAAMRKATILEDLDIPDPVTLRQATKRTRFLAKPEYIFGFFEGCARMGFELEEILGWEEVCQLVKARNLDSWLNRYPPEIALRVSTRIGLTVT